MPASALSPIAQIAPPAPTANAASAPASDGKAAPFAAELRKQVDAHSDSKPAEPAKSADDSANTAPADAPPAAKIAAQQPPAPPPGDGKGRFGVNRKPGDDAAELADDATAAAMGIGPLPALLNGVQTVAAHSGAKLASAAARGANAPEDAPVADFHATDGKDRPPASLAAGQSGLAAAARVPDAAALVNERPLATALDAPITNSFAGLHAAALAQLKGETAPAAASAPLSLAVSTPATHPGWPEEVGNKVSWMAGHDESHAELTLTPPQLGKIEVSLHINGDQTTAQFTAATPATRDLIEQALPRLREILANAGINLGQADVSTSGQSNQSGQPGGGRGSPRGGRGAAIAAMGAGALGGVGSSAKWLHSGDGMVDTFA